MKALTLILLITIIAIAGCATEAEHGLREDAAFFRWITSSPNTSHTSTP